MIEGSALRESDVEGLRGKRICPYCCGGMEYRPSYRDKRALNPIDYDLIGTGRIYEPGGSFDFFDPHSDLFSPLQIATPRLWLRNQAIPLLTVGVWGAALQGGVSALDDEGVVSVATNPFASGARGAVFDATTDALALSEEIALSGIFTAALAFRTGASLAGGVNLLSDRSPGPSKLEIAADGSLTFASATASGTPLPAATFAVSTSYVLTVLRDGAGNVSARKNGVVAPGSVSVPGSVELNLLHYQLTQALTLAEVVLYTEAVVGAEIAALESYLARLVGVTL